MAAIRRLQTNADLGEFRIHAALRQMGIHLSPSTCGRIMARNRQLGLPHPAEPQPHEPREMPFRRARIMPPAERSAGKTQAERLVYGSFIPARSKRDHHRSNAATLPRVRIAAPALRRVRGGFPRPAPAVRNEDRRPSSLPTGG
jgi:hypothetical protein